MTADLELHLRGLFVNRWRCRHHQVVQDVMRDGVVCVGCRVFFSLPEWLNRPRGWRP